MCSPTTVRDAHTVTHSGKHPLPSLPKAAPSSHHQDFERLVSLFPVLDDSALPGQSSRAGVKAAQDALALSLSYSLFTGPTNVTLHPGPLFLCALARRAFTPRLSHITTDLSFPFLLHPLPHFLGI